MKFPDTFVWGAATASYQIEGAAEVDGRGESIWDRFSHTPGCVHNGDTGDAACDHYHRFENDVTIMSEIGLDAYRFSLAWPRIFPEGKGRPNPKGLDFYLRLLDALDAKGIAAIPTLYHWDLPQALQDRGGWVNRDTAKYFREYAAYVLEKLDGRAGQWITHNEPWCAAFLGYGFGVHAPGVKDFSQALAAAHHLLLSHGWVVEDFRSQGYSGEIGITLNLTPQYAASDSEEDRAAVDRADGFSNRWFLDPIFKGKYPGDMAELYRRSGLEVPIESGDLATISAPNDFLGVNYYTRSIVGYDAEQPVLQTRQLPPIHPMTKMGWEVYPDGLYRLLMRLHEEYGPVPLYITENGACYEDQPVNGEVHDQMRTQYLQGHFDAAKRAIEQGVPLKGYFVWSLLDNFEWAFGYSRRFGIIYVDFATQQRIWKDSALWYMRFLEKQK